MEKNTAQILVIIAFLAIGAVLTAGQNNIQAATGDINSVAAKWSYTLPGEAISNSPALADINGDGRLDVIVATRNGRVVAVNHNGTLLWSRNLASYYGVGEQSILSSPAVADLEGDGNLEIVVTTGSITPSVCHPGSVIVLDHQGNKAGGNWPFLTVDESIAPSGCPDGVGATPALGDVDGDGDLEIIFGAFDKRLYALHHNGALVSGFPTASYLNFRFPDWGLQNHFTDTVWSSPGLGDIDRDGRLEIVTGADEGNFGKSFGGEKLGFYCPYTSPWGYEYCGGTLHVYEGNGQITQGNILNGGRYPIVTWEIIQSSPAVADLNQDGTPDIIVGSGDYYERTVNGGNPYARRVHVIDGATGRHMAGWNDFPSSPSFARGKATGSPMLSSPAIGDIDGDGDLEVAILGLDNKLYAWHHTGQAVSGFPMVPRDATGQTFIGFYIFHDLVMGDYDGNGDMEMFFQISADLVVVDGNGQQLTSNGSNGKPAYRTGFIGVNAPALGDIDSDGRLEAVVARNRIVVFDLPNASNKASWPMFKQGASRQSSLKAGLLATSIQEILAMAESGQGSVSSSFVVANPGFEPISWSINTNGLAGGVSVTPNSGTLNPSQEVTVNVMIQTTQRAMGSNSIGSMQVQGINGSGQNVSGSPTTIGVELLLVNQLFRGFLPLSQR